MDTGLIITISIIFGIFLIISLIVFLLTRKRNPTIKQSNNVPEEIATINIGGKISQRSLVIGFRILIGVSSVISFIVIYNKTQATIDKVSNLGASAIQIMQIYSEGLFYALIVTGIALSLYILSRAYIKNI